MTQLTYWGFEHRVLPRQTLNEMGTGKYVVCKEPSTSEIVVTKDERRLCLYSNGKPVGCPESELTVTYALETVAKLSPRKAMLRDVPHLRCFTFQSKIFDPDFDEIYWMDTQDLEDVNALEEFNVFKKDAEGTIWDEPYPLNSWVILLPYVAVLRAVPD
jgi:hypothetical protein